jgi:probable rRNA maturation factor
VTVDVEVSNRSGWRLDPEAAAEVLGAALRAEGVDAGDVGLIVVDPLEMARLNADHRGKHEPTDVLSFPIDGREPVGAGVPRQLGDVVVCPAVAAGDGTPLSVLLVHGALHLVGWDHETDEGEMLTRQAELTATVERVDATPA